MIYLFSKSGLKLLESLCFTKTLFAFDFDGTLSKIVKEPGNATISKRTHGLLEQLGDQVPVAVISGRELSDLKSRFKYKSHLFVGNHGLEGINENASHQSSFREFSEDWKAQLETLIKEPREGIEIEDKIYSLAIHYRKSRKKKLAKTTILECLSFLKPSPRVIMGKCVVNIIPTGAPHKGVALLELMLKSNTKSAFYIGDDDTDEDVFSLQDANIFTVRVGQKAVSNAKFYIRDQGEINHLIETILSFLKQAKTAEFREARHEAFE